MGLILTDLLVTLRAVNMVHTCSFRGPCEFSSADKKLALKLEIINQRKQMFQSFKRARYISQNNFEHWDTGDGVHMHLWLQKNQWPANEFVDWFMRVYPQITESSKLSFKLFMSSQYEWVQGDDVESLSWLYEEILESNFQQVDKDNLTSWIKPMYDGAKSRQL